MLNDALMIGIVLALVFGSVIFYLYNRLSMTERKMTLVEGILTDVKMMMDAVPYASGPPTNMDAFDQPPEYLTSLSGPVPLQREDVDEVTGDEVTSDYQQTLEQALEQAVASESKEPYKTLQIDEQQSLNGAVQEIQVTKLSPDLDGMTIKELQALARQRGVIIPANTRRKDMIDVLKKSIVSAADLAGPEPPAGGAALE